MTIKLSGHIPPPSVVKKKIADWKVQMGLKTHFPNDIIMPLKKRYPRDWDTTYILKLGKRFANRFVYYYCADKKESKQKSYFEIIFATIIKMNEDIKEKKELEKIILCDVQIDIYPDLEKSLLDVLHDSGYPEVKIEKKIDFENLYNQKFN